MQSEQDILEKESLSYEGVTSTELSWITQYDYKFKKLSPKLDYKDHLMEVIVYGFIAGAIWNLVIK